MKILLADDHQLFLDGLCAILRGLGPDMQIECVHNGHDALTSLGNEHFDIALIDLRLPGIDGFKLLTELGNITCLVPVIMVTASENPEDAQRSLELGAMGFVSKSSSGQQITDAIDAVLKGNVVTVDGDVGDDARQNQPDWASLHHITPRQLQVLRMIRQGLSNQAIAEQLFVSKSTVKSHIAALFLALGTQNRTETIEKARQLGLD